MDNAVIECGAEVEAMQSDVVCPCHVDHPPTSVLEGFWRAAHLSPSVSDVLMLMGKYDSSAQLTTMKSVEK